MASKIEQITNEIVAKLELSKENAIKVHLQWCQQYRDFVKTVASLENTHAFDKVVEDYHKLIIADYDKMIAKAKGEQE